MKKILFLILFSGVLFSQTFQKQEVLLTTPNTFTATQTFADVTVTSEAKLVFGTGTVANDSVTINSQVGIIDIGTDFDEFTFTNSYITANSLVMVIPQDNRMLDISTLQVTPGSGSASIFYIATGITNLFFIIFNP